MPGAAPALSHGRQPGQALVELALVLPLLLVFVLGFIAILQTTLASYTVAQAARVGATRGAVHGYSAADIKQTVERVLNSGPLTRAQHAQVTTRCWPPTGFSGCPRYSAISVEVRYEGPLAFPIGPFTRVAAHASALRTSELDQRSSQAVPPLSASRQAALSPQTAAPLAPGALPGAGSILPGASDILGAASAVLGGQP